MEELNAEKIKRLKRGEAVGTAAIIVCVVITAAFTVCFTIAQVLDIYVLRMISVILLPVLLLAAVGVAAYCNLIYGRDMDRVIKNHVKEVLIENAALMHPERSVLSFGVSVNGCFAELKVNNFKETVKFDFSAFGKLSATKRTAVAAAIAERLNITFCRLYERGANYSTVSYYPINGNKQGKVIYVIENGQPDKRAYKTYLKAN